MSTPSHVVSTTAPLKPESTRVLNVEIPESEYWHVRKCATESRMSMKEFMAEFCKMAKPINATTEFDNANSGSLPDRTSELQQ